MGPVLYGIVLAEGLLAFAALHHFLLWWWSRRDRVLLVFAAFSAVVAMLCGTLVQVMTATSIEVAQTALDLRTTIGLLGYPLLVGLVSSIARIRVRWAFNTACVFFISASAASALGLRINGTVVGLNPTRMPWGETLNLVERLASGSLVAAVYSFIVAVHLFTLYAGWRTWRQDRLASVLFIITGIAAVAGSGISVLIDVMRASLPYVGVVQFVPWVPVLSLLISRESARRDERLAASEARHRTLIESAPEAIVVLDLGVGHFVDFNQKAIDMFGWSPSELVFKGPVDLSPEVQPDGRRSSDAAVGYLQQAIAGGTPTFEWMHRARDGRDILCEVSLVRLPDPHRVLVRGSMADISERKRAEAAMRDIESRHSAILESSLDGLIVVDASSRILEFNRAAETIFGHRRGDVIGADLAEILIPPALRDAHRRGIQRFATTGVSTVTGRRLEMPALRADGSEVRVELSIQPILGTNPLLFAGVVRDITERLRLEEQLRQSQKMEAIGQLAGGVAHDFNNLLTVISGYCGILVDRLPPGDPLRDDVKSISDAGHRAAALTQRLLAFSRQAVVTPRVIDINDVVRETDQILRRLIGEDILLTLTLDPAAGRVKVDPSHLGQVLINLALNARDAMPAGGGLTIATSRAEIGPSAQPESVIPPGRYARLVVSDTGSGMGPDVKARVFEPFFTTKGVGRGTGLGLAVVHGIVKQSDGHIDVASEVGRGSTFTIHLPIVEEAANRIAPRDPTPAARGVETVLLVEDEEAVRHLLARGLRSQGFVVLTAGDGAEALRVAHEHPERIDLLATDVVMPNMSGRDLADRLRKERSGLKVLFMSGYTDDTLLRHGIYEAREAFLQKPFALTVFASKVREVLDQA